MNDIIYAGQIASCPQNKGKCLKIYLTDGAVTLGEAPPAEGCAEALAVFLEQPLLPRTETGAFKGDCEGLSHAVRKAAEYYAARNGVMLTALGELIAAYIRSSLQTEDQPIVRTLKEEIERGVADSTYSVEASIGRLPLNYDYVRKLFKKQTGVTPHEYLVQLRMKRAKAIILSGVTNRYSEYSVSQIAEACGFAEPLYFSRVFKKYYGVSPLIYSNMAKSGRIEI